MTTPLLIPKEVQVTANETGEPIAVILKNRQRRVRRIKNTWRIEDDWWKEEIARQYFELDLDSGSSITMFYDLLSRKWYQQRY